MAHPHQAGGVSPALDALTGWLHRSGGPTAYHLDNPGGAGHRALLEGLIARLGAHAVAIAAPNGKEATRYEDLVQPRTNCLTAHRAAYRIRRQGETSHFLPRGDCPLWNPQIRLVVIPGAQRLMARDAAHLLAPGKPILLLSDSADAFATPEAFLAERTPDCTMTVETAPEVPHGRLGDALAAWLADPAAGSWLRLNIDEHDGPLSALAGDLKRHLPHAVILTAAHTGQIRPLIDHTIGEPIDLAQARDAARAGRPLIVLCENDTLMPVTLKRELAALTPLVVVTRTGQTAPMVYADTVPDARTIALSRQPLNDRDTLTLERENGQPTRIVVLANDYAAGLFAGQTFSALP